MMRACLTQKLQRWFIIALTVGVFTSGLGFVPKVSAVPVFIQVKSASANSTTVSAAYSPAPIANHLLVVVCATRTTSTGATTFTTPTGFTLARNNSGSTVFQSIFYKISDGTESTVQCSASRKGRMFIQVYEYAGNTAANVLQTTGTSTGTSTTVSTGSVTTTSANAILLGAVVKNSGGAATTWSSGFTERVDVLATGRYFGVDYFPTTINTYSSGATSSTNANWLGQIAAFNLMPIILSADIVDAAGVPVAAPAVAMATQTFGFGCQTSTGTIGSATQKIRVNNTTATPGWVLSIAPTAAAASAKWSDGTNSYDVNDPTSAGCSDGADGDALAGQLTINPSTVTLTPATGCTNTGITLGTSTALSQGVTDAVTIATGGATAGINCYWDITGVSVSQTIPAEQAVSTTGYTLSLTLTIIAQ